MRKIIIASHHKMASGIKDTLEFIAGEQQNVMAIDAYLDNVPLDDTLKTIFQEKKMMTRLLC
jgi:Phosphotransferase system, mannose/fructose-specific component IIA